MMPRTEAESKLLKSEERRKARELKQHQPTVKDVLLERWAKDTEAMAKRLIENDLEDGGYFFDSIETKSGRGYTIIYQVALDGEIAYLNSAAEGATK